MKISLVFFCLFSLLIFFKKDQLLENGPDFFFPKKTYEKMMAFNSFKITNWNNIILNEPNRTKTSIKLTPNEICDTLKNKYKQWISKIICQTESLEYTPLLESYLSDQFLIFPAPDSKTLEKSAEQELAKLTLFMGPEAKSLMGVMRLDPMGFKESLLENIQRFVNKNYTWQNGFLRNSTNTKIVIPIQFSYPPSQIEKTAEIMNFLREQEATMLGPYEGFYSNRRTIEEDLNKIGILGTVITVIFVFLMISLRLLNLIKLIIPTALGIALSLLVIWPIYGKIHGITLAFGTGIIGLAIDYGFHFVFSKNKKSAWKSNLFALLTTLVVFGIFLTSSIPLIRQMMVFSIIGLIFSYIFSRILLAKDHIQVTLNICFKKSKAHLLTLPLILLGIFSFFSQKVDTKIERFNFIPPDVRKAQQSFFSSFPKEKIFFKIYLNSEIEQIENDYKTIKTQFPTIRSESIFDYIPLFSQQKDHLNSWMRLKNTSFKFTGNSSKMFFPFEEKLSSLHPSQIIEIKNSPPYLQHLLTKENVLNLWFTKEETEENIIRENIPKVRSLNDMMAEFANSLSTEVTLFMPLTILAIIGLLYFKYSSLKKSFICLIPFLFTLGVYGLFYKYFPFPLSFMSFLGIFLIYGFSVDYGIFSTDFFTEENKEKEEESAFNLGLIVNWASAFIGFLPMLWCQHPILFDLGVTLVVGMLGIFYSTFFVIPSIFLVTKK